MATILVTFNPSAIRVFSFSAVFTDSDGNTDTYTITVPWNQYAQRYYVQCTSQQGQRIYTLPLIGSPQDSDISMNAGYFATSFVYRVSSGNFEITDVT